MQSRTKAIRGPEWTILKGLPLTQAKRFLLAIMAREDHHANLIVTVLRRSNTDCRPHDQPPAAGCGSVQLELHKQRFVVTLIA